MDKLQKLQRIDELTKDLSVSKFNLLKMGYLVRIVKDSHNHSPLCETCKSFQDELDLLIEEIPHLEDIEHRQPYETKFNKMRTHYHKNHGYIPPHYFSSRYSIFGLLISGSAAALISFLITKQVFIDFILAGISIGLIGGYLLGSYKELQFRQSKKII